MYWWQVAAPAVYFLIVFGVGLWLIWVFYIKRR
jgi:hypothetical protein